MVTLWYRGHMMGHLSGITSDQPWFFADLLCKDRERVNQLERISHFLNVLIEQMPDFKDPEEDDRHYDKVLRRERLTEQLLNEFRRGPWEIRHGDEREEIQVYSLQDGILQWRGPTALVMTTS